MSRNLTRSPDGGKGGRTDGLARRLANLDRDVALAVAKRDAGQELTRRERWLLSFEDLQFTPEKAAKVLLSVAMRGGRGAGARVQAVAAMMDVCGDKVREHRIAGPDGGPLSLTGLLAAVVIESADTPDALDARPSVPALPVPVDPPTPGTMSEPGARVA